jgi:hypothetical protein
MIFTAFSRYQPPLNSSQSGSTVPPERIRQLFTKPLPAFEFALYIEPYQRSALSANDLNEWIWDCASREEWAALDFILQNEQSLEITKPFHGCSTLLDRIATNCAAAQLKLSNFEVNEDTVNALRQLLKTSTTLTSLTFVRCEIRNADRCELLVDALRDSSTLKEVFFESCFTDEPKPTPDSKQTDNEELLHRLLAKRHAVTETSSALVRLDRNGMLDQSLLKEEAARVLATQHLDGRRIESLTEQLHAGALECLGKLPFAAAQLISLADLADLQTLSLTDCRISNDGRLAAMLASLAANTHLQRLDLTGNHFDAACLQELAEALSRNKVLTSISFTRNGTDAGLAPLVDALQKNPSLRELSIVGAARGKNRDTLSQLIERNKNHHFELQIGGAVVVAEYPGT